MVTGTVLELAASICCTQVPPKHLYLCTKLHIISHKLVIFILHTYKMQTQLSVENYRELRMKHINEQTKQNGFQVICSWILSLAINVPPHPASPKHNRKIRKTAKTSNTLNQKETKTQNTQQYKYNSPSFLNQTLPQNNLLC
jgi:hypothetical protein